MSRPDVDDVLNYLSIKFNKIFCDRDFVCCVIADFQTILDKKSKSCVLVFPTLGPIYLKALRYQARIFDLAVFNITSASGKFKSLAVCHKDHLKKTNLSKEETMSEPSLCKRKRPERQLYIPPAQRGTRLSTKVCDKKVTNKVNQDHQKILKNKQNSVCDLDAECLSESESVVLNLSDVVNFLYSLNSFPSDFINLTNISYQHNKNCEFKKLLDFKKIDTSFRYNHLIQIYNFCTFRNNYWKLSSFNCVNRTILNECFKSYPVFNLNVKEVILDKPPAILVNCELSDFEKSIIELQEVESNIYLIECDKICDEYENYDIIDLSVLNLGHFFIISKEENDYFYECQEKHDAADCCANIRKKLEINIEAENINSCAIESENEKQSNENININHREIKSEKSETNETPKNNTDIVKNKINKSKKKTSNNKNEHEQEKEIMRITKENINRKTRPIMKYVDDINHTLKIDKNDGVNNWEDLFDDNGQIQEELLTEIVEKVGDDVTIVAANEDYTAYTNKPPEDLEHVVELYNFPASLETHDLVQAFSDINSDAMYIKWVDDTHALLVLGSLSQAQKAINMRNPLIKVRPMTAASAISMDVANKSDLKPAMKRPPTNLQTARRLITTHLGTKTKLTKEQIAKEKQDLKDAREMKRLIKQNEKDAWEGNIRSSVN